MVVEFWKECTGALVDRPPEGWDDLGVGGAEVQGRWAWGKERKSSIEEGVAARTFFWGKGISRSESTVLILKVLFLLLLSWFAVASLAITCLSAPVATGRLAMTLLRLPDKYLHDPIAFAIGLVALVNIGAVVMRLKGQVRRPRSFRLPPWRKGAVVAFALVMWNFIIPSMLGFLYELIVLKSKDWFAGEAPLMTSSSFLMNLSSGALLLNVWAGLCIKSAFTKQFWVNIGMLAMEGEGDNADIPNADPPIDRGGLSPWQGSQRGRVALFFDVMKDALLRWEWDRVDPDLLLSQVVHPIAKAILTVLAFPCFAVAVLAVGLKYLELPEDSLVSDGVLRLLVFRVLGVVTIGMQCFFVFNEELKEWFKIVHEAARDDRYLVGELLLDYSAH
jgi:E3 ubiquitin-protein ligase MARCH6